MKRFIVAALSAVFSLSLGVASAQDNQEPVEIVSKIVPVELWTCTYNDGKGPADLDAMVASIAPRSEMTNYTPAGLEVVNTDI